MKERLKALEKDPQHSWKLSPLDWKQSEVYDRFVHYGERVLRRTSRDYAPWYVVEGADERYRALTVGRILLEGLQAALATGARQAPAARRTAGVEPGQPWPAGLLDLGQYLDKDAYKEQLAAEQARLAGLIRDKRFRQHSLVAVFEGNDAAGKGGAIRRVTDALDPRQYHIVPIAAPTEEERAQPYLWRFWRHIPARRQFTIFDRSWYGRVLVERIEGFCAPADWLRAYGEINDFEEQLSEYGIIVVKFWLAIDKQTQMERFKEREKTPTSATRSPRKTGATATSGTSTWTRWATWSTVPAPRSRPGPWSKPTTSASPGSRCCAPSTTPSRRRTRRTSEACRNAAPSSPGMATHTPDE